jgi:hypothetical protein
MLKRSHLFQLLIQYTRPLLILLHLRLILLTVLCYLLVLLPQLHILALNLSQPLIQLFHLLLMLLSLHHCLLLLLLLTLPQLVYDLIHLSYLKLIGFLTAGFLFLHGFSDIVDLPVLALRDD